jgi:hypothetical protein
MDPDVIAKVAERKIQEAIDEGKFDDLPGRGKPLVFDDDPMTPPHLRLANRILKNANVLPEWMQAQKELEAERKEIERVRARLRSEYPKRRAKAEAGSAKAAQTFADWHAQARADYLRRLKSVNTSLLKLNLMAPSTVQIGVPFKTEAEMAAFDTEFLAPATPASAPAGADSSREGILRGIARERYASGITRQEQKPTTRPTGTLFSAGADREDIRTKDAPE